MDNIYLFKHSSNEGPIDNNEYQCNPRCLEPREETQPTNTLSNNGAKDEFMPSKPEVLALRAENERLNLELTAKIDEINLIKASQKHLFALRLRKEDSASRLDSGKKRGSIRDDQEELSNRTLVERMVSLKLDKYKKKYSKLKQLLSQFRKHEKLVQRLKSKNKSLNALNKSVLKSLMTDRCKEPMVLASEKPGTEPLEGLSPQKMIVCEQIAEIHSNTVKILETIGYMKDRSKALITRTPTTNFLDEDKQVAATHSSINANIGKRSVYESKSMSSIDSEEYQAEYKKLIEEKKKEIEGNRPAKGLISYGGSDEEESSLSIGLEDTQSLLKQLQQKANLLAAETNPNISQPPPSAITIPTSTIPLPPKDTSSIIVRMPQLPTNSILPSISLSRPPTFLQHPPNLAETPKPSAQTAFNIISLFRHLIKRPITADSRTHYFDILRAWKETESCLAETTGKEKSLDVLLLRHSKPKSYDLKSLIGLKHEHGTEMNVFQKFVAQNILYLVHTNLEWKLDYSDEEKELVTFLTDYESRNPFLCEKFQKLKDIISKNRLKQQTTQSQPSKSPSVATHYALLKIIFNHLMFYMEQKIEYLNTEDYFNSSILAKKISFKELQNSASFVIKKILSDIKEVHWLEGLDDLLVSIHDLFIFGETQKMNFNKAYYEALQGFFANIKYRNTVQQLMACLVLVQLNPIL